MEKNTQTRLAIFDLDGTLINSVADLGAATNYALSKFSYPTHDLSEYNYFVGNGVNKLIERALPADKRSADDIAAVKEHFMFYYMQHKTDLTTPYPGIPELLRELSDRKIKLAVCSNKFIDGTRALVANFFADIDFCAVLGQRDNVPVKPDPAIVFEALQMADCAPEECIYIGDSGIDMQTASNAGVESVGVTWGFRPKTELVENGACHIADEPAQILQYLR